MGTGAIPAKIGLSRTGLQRSCHLNLTTDKVTFPLYFTITDGMSAEERKRHTNEELLRQVNPCALQVLIEYKDKPDPGSCMQFSLNVQPCDSDDYQCASYTWEQLMSYLECGSTKFSRLASGVPSTGVGRSSRLANTNGLRISLARLSGRCATFITCCRWTRKLGCSRGFKSL